MEQIEDEIEESGKASKEAMDWLQLFCQAMNPGLPGYSLQSRRDECGIDDISLP